MGMAQNPERTPEQTQQFMDIDPIGLKMPFTWRIESLRSNRRFGRVRLLTLRWACNDVAKQWAAWCVPSTMREAPDDRNMFIGAVHDIMSKYAQVHGKPMGDKEIQAMGTQLMQKIAQERAGWFGKTFRGPRKCRIIRCVCLIAARNGIIQDWKKENFGAGRMRSRSMQCISRVSSKPRSKLGSQSPRTPS